MDFHYTNFIDEELIDESDQIISIAKKTWLSSASTNLANLERVQTSVYNVGLTDLRDLKATNLRTRRKGPSGTSTVNNEADSLQSAGTLKAWGSNSSIPESVNQYGGGTLQKPTRPGSAKFSNNRIRPPSGRKPRPQSAKESLPSGIVSEQTFGVKGARYDPSGRPPKGVPSTSGMGWVGPPAGLKYPDRPDDGVSWQIDLPMEDDDDSVDMDMANNRALDHYAPPPPPASPVPPEPPKKTKRVFELFIGDPYKVSEEADENMFESSDEEDLFDLPRSNDCSHLHVNHTDNHAHNDVNHYENLTPEKESLRLSLPIAEDDYDEADEIDTERLLAEAELVSKKFDLKGIISANKNIPVSSLESDSVHQTGSTNQNSWIVDDVELTNKNRAADLVSEIITENGLKFQKGNGTVNMVLERDKAAVKFSEDVTTVNITPRNIGRKVEELHQKKKKSAHHTTDNFVNLIEIKNRIEPVLSSGKADFSHRDMKSPPRSSTRPPSGKTMATENIKHTKQTYRPNSRKNVPFIYSAKVDNTQTSPLCNRPHSAQSRPRSANIPLNRSEKAITTVTVDYREVETVEKEEQKNDPKKRNLKKVDVLTMMQKLNLDEVNVQGDINRNKDQGHLENKFEEVKELDNNEAVMDIMAAPTVCKSEHEKNYYEISRHSSMSNVSVKEDSEKENISEKDISLPKENTVYKTTKTLEFDEVEPKEVIIRNIIDPQLISNKEKDRFLATSPDIKHRKPVSRSSSAKPPISMKPGSTDDHERPGSRLGFVAMAPEHLSSDRNENKAKMKVIRPASAPTYKRPRSAIKDKDNKSKTSRHKELTEQEKEEREKVIDNLLDRTKSLADDMPDNTDDAAPKKPSVERKKPRPFSAHVGLLSRMKEQTVRPVASKRPVSATTSVHRHYASYSRGSSAGPTKSRKSSGKTRVALAKPCIINTNTSYFEEETEEDVACQRMEKELAEKGVNISAATLQRALYPPSGKSRYYQITADLPKKSSISLLSHPKVWLPEEHKRLQKAERILNKANEAMFLQEKAEKRRAFLASLTPEQRKRMRKKGKKGGVKKS